MSSDKSFLNNSHILKQLFGTLQVKITVNESLSWEDEWDIMAFIPNFVWAYNYIQVKLDFVIFKLHIMHQLWALFYQTTKSRQQTKITQSEAPIFEKKFSHSIILYNIAAPCPNLAADVCY